jgi:nicotinamide mononucleotide transporter
MDGLATAGTTIDRAPTLTDPTPALDPPRPRHFAAVESAAVAITLACVWLTGEQSVWCWPAGIAGSLLYIYVFERSRLYSDVLLQGYFVLTSVYGWYTWTHGALPDGALAVGRLTVFAAGSWAAVGAAGTAVLGGLMRRYTRAALPFRDAAITVGSLIAQYLLTGKVLENWVIWIAVDALAVGVYAARRLYMTAALYAVLLLLALRGLLEWLART